MERLTYRDANGEAWYSDVGTEADRLHFIADMEEILGENYDLDRLRELVEADQEKHCHIGRCVECEHYEGLAVCELLGECGGTDWICGWFEPKKDAETTLKGDQHGEQ